MGDSIFREGALKPRRYQKEIANVAKAENTLVILPTGLGKTLIATLVVGHFLNLGKKAAILAPTKPLAEQHRKTILETMLLGEEDAVLITGQTAAGKRGVLWKRARVALGTPQTLENDLRNGRANLGGMGIVVFDEAHRCVGKYAYTYVARKCRESGVRVLGLTASPGANELKIRGITRTLGIERVEIRDEGHEDVKEYVQPTEMKWVEVELPDSMRALRGEMEALIAERAAMFERLGLIRGSKRISKKRLVEIKRRIDSAKGGWKYSALSRYAELFNLLHAHELLETQGLGTFLDFFERMKERESKSKAVQRLLNDRKIGEIVGKARAATTEHPKLGKLEELIRERGGKSFIVFVQYRDQITRVVERLSGLDGVRPVKFVGKGKGVSQKDQKRTIERFRAGEHNVLVATQIGEEGLDIPSVDCVIFYEPIPSEIRNIQRRGRAGRTRAGEVIVLITKGTRDEVYYWVSRKKERKMKGIIRRMQKRGGAGKKKVERKGGQTSMLDYM